MAGWTYSGVDLNADPFSVIDYGGFGSVNPGIQEVLLAGRDGAVELNQQRGSREAVLLVGVLSDSEDDVLAALDRLHSLPPGDLVRTRGDGRVFVMPQARIIRGLADNPQDSLDGTYQRVIQLSLRSNHPNLIDPEVQSAEAEPTRLIFDNPFPWRMPKTLENGRLGALFNINYHASADTHSIVLRIPGPASNPALINLTDPLRSKVQFDVNIAPGQIFAVNLDDIPTSTPLLSASAPPFLIAGSANQLLYSHEGEDVAGRIVSISYFNEYLGS